MNTSDNRKLFSYDSIQKENPYSYLPLGYFYSSPNSSFCQFPSHQDTPTQQKNVYFFYPNPSTYPTYSSFSNAYPAFQYRPCYYPNTSL